MICNLCVRLVFRWPYVFWFIHSCCCIIDTIFINMYRILLESDSHRQLTNWLLVAQTLKNMLILRFHLSLKAHLFCKILGTIPSPSSGERNLNWIRPFLSSFLIFVSRIIDHYIFVNHTYFYITFISLFSGFCSLWIAQPTYEWFMLTIWFSCLTFIREKDWFSFRSSTWSNKRVLTFSLRIIKFWFTLTQSELPFQANITLRFQHQLKVQKSNLCFCSSYKKRRTMKKMFILMKCVLLFSWPDRYTYYKLVVKGF